MPDCLTAVIYFFTNQVRKFYQAVDDKVYFDKKKAIERSLAIFIHDCDGKGRVRHTHGQILNETVAVFRVLLVEEDQKGAEREQHSDYLEGYFVVAEEGSEHESHGAGGDYKGSEVEDVDEVKMKVVDCKI